MNGSKPYGTSGDPQTSRGRILTLPPGAPVSDPAGIQKRPETRRIGDRRSAVPSRVGGSVKMRPLPGKCQLCSTTLTERRLQKSVKFAGQKPSRNTGARASARFNVGKRQCANLRVV